MDHGCILEYIASLFTYLERTYLNSELKCQRNSNNGSCRRCKSNPSQNTKNLPFSPFFLSAACQRINLIFWNFHLVTIIVTTVTITITTVTAITVTTVTTITGYRDPKRRWRRNRGAMLPTHQRRHSRGFMSSISRNALQMDINAARIASVPPRRTTYQAHGTSGKLPGL
ncbi:hypothetical protein MIMGU_mgv1a015040mg [Erythranthe guttata]|uniref:Uncharacterized protein n=1 Tax=Erythranthe guttata TaxID=4155 RepID=A0A022R5G3_ERYGU|nr:hypothetical protein MIMGU_mgv1a015040mg [Erythranthe guttata]